MPDFTGVLIALVRDRNVEHLRLASVGLRQEFHKDAHRVLALWKRLRHLFLAHIVDAGFCRRRHRPPSQRSIAAGMEGPVHSNLGKMLAGLYFVLAGRRLRATTGSRLG